MITLIDNLIQFLKEKYEKRPIPTINDVFIGLGFTGLELSNGVLGICYTPRQVAIDKCCSFFDTPGTLIEKEIFDLIEFAKSNYMLDRVVGIAGINSLSQTILKEGNYKLNTTDDVLQLIPFTKSDNVVMVGNIGPFVQYIQEHSKNLTVIDDNPRLQEIQMQYEITTDINRLKDADISIITGSSIVVGNIDDVLDLAKNSRHVSIVGPTAGWLPEPFFEKDVEIIAGSSVVDVEKTRRVILEGGGARKFFPYVEKYTLQRSILFD